MNELIHDIEVLGVRGDPATTEVRGIELDSRKVGEGSLFCCVPGEHTDGHRHAAEAVAGGATALLCEHFLELDVTQVRVGPGGVRPAMAELAAAFYHRPAARLTMIGVTGTNGKTTVTQLLGSILEAAGMPAGVIATLDGARTTPEAPALQRLLADLAGRGRRAVAMEVSSHGLAQHRVDGIVFEQAVFTNLSRDHLDHHGSMDEYFAAKARLFEAGMSRAAVINVDDPWGARLADRLAGRPVVRVRRSDAADPVLRVGSTQFRWRSRTLTVPLAGMFNVDNALLAVSTADALGIDGDRIAEGLAAARPVPGRMEVVAAGPPFAVLVDYAHTPAGLEAALSSARALAGAGRVLSVFGCGGDRDRGKRPEMGAVAARWSDVVVLTSDNPRSEDPGAIIDQIRAGVDEAVDLVVEPDRSAAIARVLGLAGPGDVVIIAGKGHETDQVLAGRVVPFDDRVEARRVLGQGARGAGS